MKLGTVGVCRSLVWPPTSHPYCPNRTQRLLSNSSGQRFGQTRRAAEAAEGFESGRSRCVQEDQSGAIERGNGLSSLNGFFQKCRKSRNELTCSLSDLFVQSVSLWRNIIKRLCIGKILMILYIPPVSYFYVTTCFWHLHSILQIIYYIYII